MKRINWIDYNPQPEKVSLTYRIIAYTIIFLAFYGLVTLVLDK